MEETSTKYFLGISGKGKQKIPGRDLAVLGLSAYNRLKIQEKRKLMTLENGRPQDLTGRLPREVRTYDFLDGLGIDYQRIDHEVTMTMEACGEIDRVLHAPTCKNLLLCNRQCTDFYLLLIPGDKPLKTSVLSKEIGSSRLSFAKGEYMEEFLDITPGSLSVLGLMNDRENRVKLLIDREVLNGEFFGCHPCQNTTTLRFTTRDLMEKIIPAMGHAPTIVDLPVPEAAE